MIDESRLAAAPSQVESLRAENARRRGLLRLDDWGPARQETADG